VIDRAEAVNDTKDQLRERFAAVSHLRELQRSDLSLLAAYRQIPILTGRVKRVACTRARHARPTSHW
jgi:hypothetical protein